MIRESAAMIRAFSFTVSVALFAATARAEPVEFVAKFPAGQVCVQTSSDVSETVVTDSTSGESHKLTMKLFREAVVTVVRADKSGALVEGVYKTLAASISGPSGTNSYDSAKDQPDATPLAQGMSPLVNAKVQFHYNPAGKVEKVEGYDAIWAAHPGTKEKNPFRQFFADDLTKLSANTFLDLLPSKPVSIGDLWESESAASISGFAIKLHTKCKLTRITQSKGHKLAEIEFAMAGKMDGTPAAPKSRYDEFESRGTAEFDLTQDGFTSADAEIRSTGSIELKHQDGKTTVEKVVTTRSATLSYRW
jgi:Family of unknown function (DUF6263)